MILTKLSNGSELKEHIELLDEGCRAAGQYTHGDLFLPDIYHKALVGEAGVFLVGEAEGICVCSAEQGNMYVNVLYIRVGARKGLMQQTALELLQKAQELGLQEVRFKTQRAAGMKKALGEIGFVPRCVEFAAKVERD